MRIHGVRHVEFEGLALIEEWALERDHEVTSSMAPAESYPDPHDIDWLVIMGGPMAADDPSIGWLAAEKACVEHAIGAGCMILGVCLGAQIVAEVIGGEVSRNPVPEVGWWPIQLTSAGRASPVFGTLPTEFTALSWHSDTFWLPPGVGSAARSDACANQAFEFAERVWGLQFHLEWDEAALEAVIARCGDDLGTGPYIRSAEELRAGVVRHSAEVRRLLSKVLDAMSQVGPARRG